MKKRNFRKSIMLPLFGGLNNGKRIKLIGEDPVGISGEIKC